MAYRIGLLGMTLDCDDMEADAETVRDMFAARGRTVVHMWAVLGVLMSALLDCAAPEVRTQILDVWCDEVRSQIE